ncbi:hypothetical protein DMENIID0001_161350 [Sergentomyia squamirostris]
MNEEENVHITDGDDRLEEEKSPCDLLDEFTRIYEDSIKFIDKNIGNKCPELKLKTYKKWVCDLTEQNRELVKSVEELETVVTARLNLLESKLEEEKYSLHDRKMFRLESDLHNLVRFLRRISQENSWSTEGLTFQEIDLEKILSDIREEKEIDDEAGIIVEMTPNTSRIFTDGLENISKEMSNIRDDIKNSAIVHNAEESYKIFEENAMLREELASSKRSIQELVEKNRELEKAASDTQVLVEEIAKKHDKIQKMRSENGLLEESIRQANAQIKFKEDVIKELRRDISNLKKTFSPSERDSLDSSISDLSRDIQAKKSEIQEMGEKQKQDQRCLEKIAEELNQLKVDLGLKIPEVEEENSSNFVPEIEMLNAMKHEFFNLKHTISVLTVENGDFRKQIQGFKTQSSSVAEKLKELKDVQQVVFEIQSSIKSFDNDNNPDEIAEDKGSVEDVLVNFREQLERVRRENAEKSDELTKKETEIKTLMEQLEKQKVEMENMTEKKEFLETERIKNDQVIQDLKNAIKTHTDTENELKMAFEDLQKRLKDMESGHQTNEIFTKLLADKNRLEVECHHQMTTISNLKEAVESMKKNGRAVSSSPATSTNGSGGSSQLTAGAGGGSSSLWGWWRSVHDV